MPSLIILTQTRVGLLETVKNLSKKQSSVPALNDGEYTITDKEKAKLLNNHFSRSFNYSLLLNQTLV